MRLWSVNPKLLDTKGLVAVWREGLLAKKVLEGRTKGYRHHPQLIRFRECTNPLMAINYYLYCIYLESVRRGFCFDRNKLLVPDRPVTLTVTRGQLNFELLHLNRKLVRSPSFYSIVHFDFHPMFRVVDGDVEEWEKI